MVSELLIILLVSNKLVPNLVSNLVRICVQFVSYVGVHLVFNFVCLLFQLVSPLVSNLVSRSSLVFNWWVLNLVSRLGHRPVGVEDVCWYNSVILLML